MACQPEIKEKGDEGKVGGIDKTSFGFLCGRGKREI